VLTDVDMPGSLNGFEFARLVKQGWPEVGVLTISGKAQPAPGDLPEGVEFVRKPFRPRDLVERVQNLLAFQMPQRG
jgi:two-component system, response regulator PdtaR